MLCEFLCKRTAPRRQGVDGIVNRNLALFMVQKVVNVFTAFPDNLLAE